MADDKPQGTEGAEGTVGEDSPYQLAVSKCRALMTEGKKEAASDEYNEAVNLNKDAENDELLLLSDQLDAMEEGTPFEFPIEGDAPDAKSKCTDAVLALTEAELESLADELKLVLTVKEGENWKDMYRGAILAQPEKVVMEAIKNATPATWHEKAGQSLESDELKSILKELDIKFNLLTGQKKLQTKFDEYNASHGYIAPEAPAETPKKEEAPKAEKPKKEDKAQKDKRGKKAKPVTLDDCIEACQQAAVMLQQYERQEREAGHSTRRYRRAWQAIHGMIIKKCLRRS